MLKRIIILGGGSAGFIAALALKRKLRDLPVTVIRSKEIGIIGVGEGSTPALSRFLHEYLGMNPKKFFAVAQPTWKVGLGPPARLQLHLFLPATPRRPAPAPAHQGLLLLG